MQEKDARSVDGCDGSALVGTSPLGLSKSGNKDFTVQDVLAVVHFGVGGRKHALDEHGGIVVFGKAEGAENGVSFTNVGLDNGGQDGVLGLRDEAGNVIGDAAGGGLCEGEEREGDEGDERGECELHFW